MAVARGNWEAVEVLTRHGARIESLDAEVDALVAAACRKSEEAERETARVLAPAKAFRDAKLVRVQTPRAPYFEDRSFRAPFAATARRYRSNRSAGAGSNRLMNGNFRRSTSDLRFGSVPALM